MADGPIDLNKIFKIDDLTPITKVIENLETFDALLDKLGATAKKNAADIVASMSSIQKATDSLEATMKEADVTTKTGQDQIAKGAEATGKMITQSEQYKKALKELEEEIKILTEQQVKLQASKENIKKATDAEVGSLNELKKQYKEAKDYADSLGKSTDATIKQEAIDKTKQLKAQVETLNDAYKTSKKVTDTTIGSYNELQKQVTEATKKLKSFEGGVGSTSKEFKDLQKFVQDGNAKLKDFDATIGNNTRKVGSYEEAIAKFLPGMRAINPAATSAAEGVATFGKQILALLTSGPGLIIAAIVAGLLLVKHSLDKYYNDSIEGQDKLNNLTNTYSSLLEGIDDRFEALGSAIQPIIDNLANGFAYAIASLFGAQDEFIARVITGIHTAQLQNELRKEQIELTIEEAKTALEAAKSISAARDNLRNTEEERYNQIQRNKQLEEDIEAKRKHALENEIAIQRELIKENFLQLKPGQDALELLRDETAQQNISYELITKLAELEAKRFQMEADRLNGAKKRNALEIGLIKEVTKERQAATQLEQDAQIKTDEAIIQHRINTNNRIVGNQEYSIEEQLAAATQATEDLINIQDIGVAKEIQAARTAAFERVDLDSKTTDAIFKNSQLSFSEKISTYIAEKNKLIDIDATYLRTARSIQDKAEAANLKAVKDGGDKLAAIIAGNYQHFITLQKGFIKQDSNEQIRALDAQFEAGLLSLKEYNQAKAAIQDQAKDDNLKVQKDELTRELTALKTFLSTKKDITQADRDLLTKINSELEQTLTDQAEAGVSARVDAKKREAQLLKQLQQELFDSAQATGDNLFQAQQQRIQASLQTLSDQKEQEIKLAGDNAEAKQRIEERYQKKIDEEQKKLRASQRRQAIYDKGLSALNILVNGAQAAIAALAPPPTGLGPVLGVPLAVTVGAITALQEAAVLSKPIPTYAKGRRGGPAEWAIVAEDGPEIVQEGSKATLYDTEGAQLVHLGENANVFTAKETERILDAGAFNNLQHSFSRNSEELSRRPDESSPMYAMMARKFDQIDSTIRHKKELHINVTAEGVRAMVIDAERWIEFVNSNYR